MAEIGSGVWGTRANFNGFRILAALLHDTSSRRQPDFATLNRGRHLYSTGRPSRWALAHISSYYCYVCLCTGKQRRALAMLWRQMLRSWSCTRTTCRTLISRWRQSTPGWRSLLLLHFCLKHCRFSADCYLYYYFEENSVFFAVIEMH